MSSLFDNLPHNGTATSRAAAAAKESRGTADSDRNKIMVYLYQWPDGATRQQLASVLGIRPDSVRPRVAELLAGGNVVEPVDDATGKPATRIWGGHESSKVVVHHQHSKGTL